MVFPAAKGTTVISRAGGNNRGFTLLELILVLVVLGLSSLLVLPSIDKGLRDQKIRRSALALAAAARDLRSRAVNQGVPQQLVLDVLQNSYLLARNREIHLPAEIKIAGVDGGETLDRGVHRFLFFPNGSTFGGQIIVSGVHQSDSYSIRLEPLTGKIEVLRSGPS
jgi:general secretion pathway protein H